MPIGWKFDAVETYCKYSQGIFKDSRSKVDTKGHDHLKGKDVGPFRFRVFERSQQQCECVKEGVRCDAWLWWPDGFEMHHDPDGYERYDSMESCFAFCRPCHRARHVQVKLGTISA